MNYLEPNDTVWRSPDLARAIAALAESRTVAIDTKAKALAAAGHDIVSFAAGEPDSPTPDDVVEAAVRAASNPAMHRYGAPGGEAALRAAIAERTQAETGVAYGPESVVVTNGTKQAVFEACAAVIDPGDEVLVPSPAWVTYPEVVRWHGGVVVDVPTGPADNWHLHTDALEAARTARTKALILSSPCNPTGATLDADEVAAVAEWCDRHGVWLLCDDIYHRLVHPPAVWTSPVAAHPPVAPRTLLLDGTSKSFSMCGWRVGWLVGPPAVTAAVIRLQGHLTGNVNRVAQAAAQVALADASGFALAQQQAVAARIDSALEIAAGWDGVVCARPEGAFYLWADVRGVLADSAAERAGSGPGPGVTSSLELAELLLDRAGVAVVPGEAFGAPGYLRFAVTLAPERLADGLRRAGDVFAELA